jgi:hypothetical protein
MATVIGGERATIGAIRQMKIADQRVAAADGYTQEGSQRRLLDELAHQQLNR